MLEPFNLSHHVVNILLRGYLYEEFFREQTPDINPIGEKFWRVVYNHPFTKKRLIDWYFKNPIFDKPLHLASLFCQSYGGKGFAVEWARCKICSRQVKIGQKCKANHRCRQYYVGLMCHCSWAQDAGRPTCEICEDFHFVGPTHLENNTDISRSVKEIEGLIEADNWSPFYRKGDQTLCVLCGRFEKEALKASLTSSWTDQVVTCASCKKDCTYEKHIRKIKAQFSPRPCNQPACKWRDRH